MDNKKEVALEQVKVHGIIPQRILAEITGCDVETVRAVRKGKRGKSGNGDKSAKVKFADKYLHQQLGIAIQNVREILNNEN